MHDHLRPYSLEGRRSLCRVGEVDGQRLHIGIGAGREVERDHLVSRSDQPTDNTSPETPTAPRDDDPHSPPTA